MMTKWELKEQLESLRETNSKLTDANLVIAKQLENLWSEVGYKNDRVRDLTYEVSELKSEVKTLKFKWRKCIADRYAQDQEEKEKDKALIDKILNPLACKALNAVSLPEPGPFISTVRVFMPYSSAFAAAASAATCAAYGVDFLEPLKPF